MDKIKKSFYVGKGKNDKEAWLFYGSKPPYILNDSVHWDVPECVLIGSFGDNPIGNTLKHNTIIKVCIRKETIKSAKNNN